MAWNGRRANRDVGAVGLRQDSRDRHRGPVVGRPGALPVALGRAGQPSAVLTVEQVHEAARALGGGEPSFVSIFAGRIADTGCDPAPIVAEAMRHLAGAAPRAEVIWASPREIFNIFQADAVGCHIITVTNDILKKLPLIGRDLAALSLDTVQMFHDDARKAGFHL